MKAIAHSIGVEPKQAQVTPPCHRSGLQRATANYVSAYRSSGETLRPVDAADETFPQLLASAKYGLLR
jgi:hypothetical protein